MNEREELVRAFLTQNGWADATRMTLAGDASNRRYERLLRADTTTAVLMDAPPDKGEDVRPFVLIATHLCDLGLSAPRILAEDAEQGFLIVEDLGDDLFSKVLERQPELEETLYRASIDTLVHLRNALPPKLSAYDAALMTEYACLAFAKYKAGIHGAEDESSKTAFKMAFEPLLRDLTKGPQVLVQRDYHAENVLWLPKRTGVAKVGLLDFQDAMLGHPAYDLVSILQDARRDVSPQIEEQMVSYYLGQTGDDPEAFRAAYAVLGVQRNMRILGVFARLSLEMGKKHYVDLIPRVWGLLQRDLNHPALHDIAQMVRLSLPEPEPEILNRLRAA